MRAVLLIFSLCIVFMADPAYAGKMTIPSTVGEVIKDNSPLALIKDAEVTFKPLGDGNYLMSLKIPRMPDKVMGAISTSSEFAACMADFLSFQEGKNFWSVGYSMEARDEYERNSTERLNYYMHFGKKPNKQLKDMAGRVIDTWNNKGEVYEAYGYKKRCANYIKPEWLSSWETYRAPISYFNVGGERLPNRIWAFHNQTVLDAWGKDEGMLPIINADVSIKAINQKLYALKVSFDEPVRGMAAMYSLMMFPSCLADYLSIKKGFEISDVGMTNSGVAKPNDKSASSEDVLSVEYFLLLDVRENEQRPVVAGVEKIGWVGGASSFALLRSAHANITGACQKIMASDLLPKR